MKKKYIFLVINLLIFTFGNKFAFSEQDYILVPHNAIYEIKLKNTKQGSNIYSINGTMQTEWLEECESWVFNQHTVLDVGTTFGENSRSEYVFSTLEDKENTNYKFLARTFSEGELEEKIQGIATKNSDGNKVVFHSPEVLGYELPNDTLFPVAHYKAIMEMIKYKQLAKSFNVFSGDSIDSLENVNVIIFQLSKEHNVTLKHPDIFKNKSLIGIRLAYFDYFSREEYPSLEITVNIASNGIATMLEIDYPGFSIVGKLREISLLKRKNCSD